MKTVFITTNKHIEIESQVTDFLDNLASDFGAKVEVDTETLFELKAQVFQALQNSGLELSNFKEMTAAEFNQAYNVTFGTDMGDILYETRDGNIDLQNIRTANFYNLQIWDKESNMRVYHKQTIDSLLGGIQEFCKSEGIHLVTGRGR